MGRVHRGFLLGSPHVFDGKRKVGELVLLNYEPSYRFITFEVRVVAGSILEKVLKGITQRNRPHTFCLVTSCTSQGFNTYLVRVILEKDIPPDIYLATLSGKLQELTASKALDADLNMSSVS